VVDEIMTEVSYEQLSGINENSGGEEIMQVLECAPVYTSNGEEKIDFTSEMESENKSELSIKKPIDQQQKMMDETHRLFRKYKRAMDSLQMLWKSWKQIGLENVSIVCTIQMSLLMTVPYMSPGQLA
jgi:hypothetical protein